MSFSTVLEKITSVFQAMPFTGPTWFVIFTLTFFVWLFAKADKTPTSLVQWEHLVIDVETNRTSPYKVGYLVGVIVSTWVVLTLTDKDKITFDLLGIYLTYLVTGAGINMYIRNKNTDSVVAGLAPTSPSDKARASRSMDTTNTIDTMDVPRP